MYNINVILMLITTISFIKTPSHSSHHQVRNIYTDIPFRMIYVHGCTYIPNVKINVPIYHYYNNEPQPSPIYMCYPILCFGFVCKYYPTLLPSYLKYIYYTKQGGMPKYFVPKLCIFELI